MESLEKVIDKNDSFLKTLSLENLANQFELPKVDQYNKENSCSISVTINTVFSGVDLKFHADINFKFDSTTAVVSEVNLLWVKEIINETKIINCY